MLDEKAQQEDRLKELRFEIKTLDSETLPVLAEKIEYTQSLVDDALRLGERLSKQKSEIKVLRELVRDTSETTGGRHKNQTPSH